MVCVLLVDGLTFAICGRSVYTSKLHDLKRPAFMLSSLMLFLLRSCNSYVCVCVYLPPSVCVCKVRCVYTCTVTDVVGTH